MFDIDKIRNDFPMLNGKLNEGKPLVYLDNGATTFKPQCVIDEVTNYYTDMTANAHRGDYQLALRVDQRLDKVRETVAKFLNCKSEEVVFTNGDSSSLNTVAFGYVRHHLKKGDVVLTSQAEHASDILPYFVLAKEMGIEIRYVPLAENGRITVENFEKAMDEKVKFVALADVGNVLGYRLNTKEIIKIAHRYGAVVSIDGAQSVPHFKTDVKDLDVDFLSFSSHKMCGPTGVGVLYGKFDLLNQTEPLVYGGGSNARFYASCQLELRDVPYKFESGTQPIEAILGFGKAVEYLMNISMEEIEKREEILKSHLFARLKELDNITLYNPDPDGSIATFNVNGIFAQDVASYLSTQGICVRSGNHCAKILVDVLGTPATVRCTLYFYNTIEEIDYFVDTIKQTTMDKCINVIF